MNRHFDAPRGKVVPPLAQSVRVFVPGPGDHFTLPSEITKAGAITTISRAMQLMGATALEVLVFRLIADRTERLAWHSGTRAPVNWRRQCDLAREAGISERHFRRIEAGLVDMGVLARATADNGYRGRRAGQPYNSPVHCGLSLEPAIANYEAFVAICAEAEVLEGQRQDTFLHIRTARRRLTLLVPETRDLETRSWAQAAIAELCDAFPPGSLRGGDLDELVDHHAALIDLEDRIKEALTPLPHSADAATRSGETVPVSGQAAQDGTPDPVLSQQEEQDEPSQPETEERPISIDSQPVENGAENTNMSGAPDSGVRSHIQPQKNLTESCNAHSPSKSTPADAGDRYSFGSPPDGRDGYFENKHDGPSAWINPAILQKLTPEAIRDLASEDAALYLDAVQDWRDALPYLLRELGVNISAWNGAVDVMGDEVAFIALLVIDRNRFHPVTPVRSPGGALRAFTDRARQGELNLARAILGIWERDREGLQPKAGPRPERLS